MRKILKTSGLILLVLLILGVGGFVLWAAIPAPAGSAALAALESDGVVYVFDKGEYILFYPAICQVQAAQEDETGETHTIKGLVFYPGARVDYRAYAPALRKIAEQGIIVILVPVRLNMAIFDTDAGAPALTDIPEVEIWAAGGHSLGGVAAALFAQRHPEITGLVFWASTPSDNSLKDSDIRILSIYGTDDALFTSAHIDASKASLPADTLFIPIQGGNHAQFGDYGPQNGDQPASIPAQSQWAQVAGATIDFLEGLAP